MRMRILAVLSVLAAVGCGEEKGDRPAENEHVAAFRAESGLEFEECGEIRTDCSEYDCGAECSDQRDTAYRCIETHFQSCSPAHYRERVSYSATGWSSDDVFVLPGEGGACQVVRFQVARAREVGCNHVARWDCAEMSFGQPNEEMDWCFLWIDGCGEPTSLAGEIGDCWL